MLRFLNLYTVNKYALAYRIVSKTVQVNRLVVLVAMLRNESLTPFKLNKYYERNYYCCCYYKSFKISPEGFVLLSIFERFCIYPVPEVLLNLAMLQFSAISSELKRISSLKI